MKSIVIFLLLLPLPSLGKTPQAAEILSCSNLHQINDPEFQQGDEVFVRVQWIRESDVIQIVLSQGAHTELHKPESFHFIEPHYSWLSGKDLDSGILFRFTYLGGVTWGGYYDGHNTHGQELMCSETGHFQSFLDDHKSRNQ